MKNIFFLVLAGSVLWGAPIHGFSNSPVVLEEAFGDLELKFQCGDDANNPYPIVIGEQEFRLSPNTPPATTVNNVAAFPQDTNFSCASPQSGSVAADGDLAGGWSPSVYYGGFKMDLDRWIKFSTKSGSVTIIYSDIQPVSYSLAPGAQILNGTATFPISPTSQLIPNGFSGAPSFVAVSLPQGLSIDPTTGIISGTPTELFPTQNVTITATNGAEEATATVEITINGYIVDFNTQGNLDESVGTTPTSLNVKPGDSAALPAPSGLASNHLFGGWFTDATAGDSVGMDGDSYAPPNSLTLYARWLPSVRIEYYLGGGALPSGINTLSPFYAQGTDFTLPIPTKDGQIFTGWYTQSTGGSLRGVGGEVITLPTITPGSTIQAHARWRSPYTYWFNLNGGQFSNITCVPGSSSFTLSSCKISEDPSGTTLPVATRLGHRFDGWWSATTGGTYYGGGGEQPLVPLPSGGFIEAQWTEFALAASMPAISATRGISVDPWTVAPVAFAPSSFSISPPLPLGLSFSTTTGEISGSPTELYSETTHTITAIGPDSSAVTTTVTVTVEPVPLSIAVPTLTRSKVYDGDPTAAVTAGTLSGVQAGDTVNVTATASYADADVGDGKTITVSYTLDGADAANYIAPADFVVTDGEISPKPLTITGLTGDNKVYDGTTTATATGTPALNGVVTADVSDVSITGTPSYTLASANVGTGIAITTTGFALDGAKKDNYTLSQPTLSADITAKPINDQSITIDAIADQAYSGSAITPTAVVKDGSTALVLDTDYTVAYADNTDVGTATITVSGIGNYGLSQTATFKIKAGLPAKPTALTAEAKDQAVTLSWTAPTDIGGSAITGYTVSATPGSATCTTATTSCTVSDLTNGTEYTFTVVATNEAGNSPASDSVSATPKADTFTLTVTNGTGSGSYAPNREVSIAANQAAEGKVFDRWIGDVDGVENINNPNTSVIVGQAITVEATYKDQPQERYTLTLNQGRGAGEYLAGATVTIAADPAPIGQIFDQWIGDAAANLVNPNKADTQFIMPASNATLTARYKDRPDEGFSLVVNEGTGDGTYLAGDLITVAADPADEGWVFVRWSGDADTLANENLPNTLLTMPSQDVTLTPLYEEATVDPEPHTLTVASGTGDGDYLPGRVVLIAADVKQDMIFDRWVGQTSGINNINLPNTTLVMGRDDVSIEATFKPDPAKAFVLTERVRLPSASAQTQTLARSGQTAGSTLPESTETVQGERDIAAGRLVALVAPKAPDGFVFDKWVGQTSHIDNIHQPSTYLYMPDKAVDVIATYRSAATAKALVVTNGSGDGDYLPGTEVAIKADTAPTGFVFDKWVGQTAQVANVNRPQTTLLMPATTVAVEAIYRALPSTTYPLVVQGGTGDGDYEAGSSVVLDIPNPPKDQIFARWTGQVGTVEDVFAAKTNLYMPATEVTVVAAFDPLYTVTASVGGVGGSVSPASQQVLGGETASITITTETGFEIKSITGCGDNGSLVGQTHTTPGIAANCALSVTFEQVMPKVEIEPVAFGQISCALNPVFVGGGVLCTAIPEDGSVFVEWAQCGGVISGNTCLLTDLDGDLNVAATFESVPAVPVNANQRWALWSLLLLLMLLAHRHMRALRLERAH